VIGSFDTIGGELRKRIACLDKSTGKATSWNPVVRGSLFDLACYENNLYICGQFTSIDKKIRNNFACFDIRTGELTDVNISTNTDVTTIVPNGNRIALGGDFTSIGGKTRSHLACFDLSKGNATDWNPEVSDTSVYESAIIEAILCSGNTIYVGGRFTTVGGQMRNAIAALDTVNGKATMWNPDIQMSTYPLGPSVKSLLALDNKLFVGGYFNSIGGQARNCIACLDMATGAPLDWNPGAGQSVNQCALIGNKLYVCGDFDTLGGIHRHALGCIDVLTGTVTDWNPDPDIAVFTILATEDKIYAGGQFNTIGGAQRSNIACIDALTGNATAWNPEISEYISALGISGTTIFAGGREHCLSLDAITSDIGNWDPDVLTNKEDYYVSVISVGEKHLFIGGNFNEIKGVTCVNVAQFDLSSTQTQKHFFADLPSTVSFRISGYKAHYTIPERMPVSLLLFNTAGRCIATYKLGNLQSGTYDVSLDMKHIPSGRYLIQLRAGNIIKSEMLSLMR
jgi:hypothetical protein